MESLFLLAFGEKEVPAAPARASSEAFFNKLLVTRVCEVTYASSAIGLVRAGLGISLLGSLVVNSNNLRAIPGLAVTSH
jgi:DNA-binding transcriptional LysR family regulator